MPAAKIGLALGGGSARGWAHIGVINALAEIGIRPDIICGTSVGAIVGAAYVTGRHEALRDWVTDVSRLDIVGLLDVRLNGGGLIEGARIEALLQSLGISGKIEDCETPFAAVATDLASGREVWLRDGDIGEALRASFGIPGIFSPAFVDGNWLVDGGLANPVPVSVCRALGAERVIAVNLGADLVGRRFIAEPVTAKAEKNSLSRQELGKLIANRIPAPLRGQLQPLLEGQFFDRGRSAPDYFQVLANSINIMQDRISRARLAGDPPDVLLQPELPDISLMDFHRGAEAMAEGHACVERALPALRRYWPAASAGSA